MSCFVTPLDIEKQRAFKDDKNQWHAIL